LFHQLAHLKQAQVALLQQFLIETFINFSPPF